MQKIYIKCKLISKNHQDNQYSNQLHPPNKKREKKDSSHLSKLRTTTAMTTTTTTTTTTPPTTNHRTTTTTTNLIQMQKECIKCKITFKNLAKAIGQISKLKSLI